MEMLHLSKETAFLIGLGVFVYGFIGIWLWKATKPSCCDHFGYNCNQGRDCPFRGEKVENHR